MVYNTLPKYDLHLNVLLIMISVVSQRGKAPGTFPSFFASSVDKGIYCLFR